MAELTTRIVQVIEVPRILMRDFLQMPESNQVCLYFLFGEAEENEGQAVYIGQTGDLRARLVTHNRDKEFWERALILISRTNSLTQTHALFLEWYCLQAARTAGRYPDLNNNSGSKPHTPRPLAAECEEIYETGKALLSTLGFPLFDPIGRSLAESSDEELFFLRSAGAYARSIYTQEGLVVLQGSVARKENAQHIIGTPSELFRLQLIASGVMQEEGNSLVFQRDHLFQSPSAAGMAVCGRNTNGWVEWKTAQGRTLDAVIRQGEQGALAP
jgi:predicted GIY-YIG superfamily endonuclease